MTEERRLMTSIKTLEKQIKQLERRRQIALDNAKSGNTSLMVGDEPDIYREMAMIENEFAIKISECQFRNQIAETKLNLIRRKKQFARSDDVEGYELLKAKTDSKIHELRTKMSISALDHQIILYYIEIDNAEDNLVNCDLSGRGELAFAHRIKNLMASVEKNKNIIAEYSAVLNRNVRSKKH